MAVTRTVNATVISKKGFYVGDVCYEMSKKDYYTNWHNNFEDFEGEHELHGHKFAIGGTQYGDGTYEDQYGHIYGVDTGTIGILPYELCENKDETVINKHGRFINAKCAILTADNGVINVEFDNGQYIRIDTNDECEDDEDDEYDEY